ncbi:hypothetical protein R4369_31295 [Rhodococcus opacus]|nr:hypothetical protein [Rhodococcus opacus]
MGDIGDRADVRALLMAHEDLLEFLIDPVSDPERGVWRSQLQRLAERYVNTVAEIRNAHLSVHLVPGDTRREGVRMCASGDAG